MNQKVKDLRIAVAVDGKNLVDPNFTDQQIEDQINLIMNQKIFSNQTIIDKISELILKVSDNLSIDDAVEWVKVKTYEFVNCTNLPKYDPEFWKHFGSAPFSLTRYKNTNINLDPSKGHKGMDEIFDDKFENGGFNQLCTVYYQLNNVKNSIEELRKFKKLRTENVISEFRTLDEIEENLPVKKAKIAAKILFKDKTVSMKERLNTFENYGDTNCFIYHPKNKNLNKIFEIYHESGYHERHENVSCTQIIDWWIDNLTSKRCFIDYSKNSCHPSLKRIKRNYKPSKNAIERLYNYYIEILLLEGVSQFELDW